MDGNTSCAEVDSGIDETVQVALHRMNAAVRYESDEMNRPCVPDGIDERWIRRQLMARDNLADADDVLIDDSSGADVEMSDF